MGFFDMLMISLCEGFSWKQELTGVTTGSFASWIRKAYSLIPLSTTHGLHLLTIALG
jgi:hypothetical protein